MRILARRLFAAAVVCGALGCEKNADVDLSEPEMAAFVELVLPRRIEIQKYWTKPVSYAKDERADGIEVILRAEDAIGDPIKAVGVYHFELHAKRMASGDPVGDLLQRWAIKVDSPDEMRKYFDRVTRFHRFPLRLEGPPLSAGKYVLVGRLVTPTSDKLFDEYEFEYKGEAAPPG